MVERDGYDVIIVGAGPSGLASAIEARKHKLSYLVIEKGCLVNTIYHLPTNLIFFSTPELLEIGSIPFIISGEKPTRRDLLNYYRKVADHFDLRVNLYEQVTAVANQDGPFLITTDKAVYSTRNLVIATGQYDHINPLNIPGENLPKVSHYFTEAHPFFRKKVAVIGGKNSAVESALELVRANAEVTLVHRGNDFAESVKYWILPDIKNRIKEGRITSYFNTAVREIKEESIVIADDYGNQRELQNDFVLALTGYKPDYSFFRRLGLELDEKEAPVHNEETLETNVPGIYIAGVVTAGCAGSKVFIENSRHHGELIMGNIAHGKN